MNDHDFGNKEGLKVVISGYLLASIEKDGENYIAVPNQEYICHRV